MATELPDNATDPDAAARVRKVYADWAIPADSFARAVAFAMPHVIVKLRSGRSDAQKARIAEDVTRAIMATANCTEAAVSVGIEDVAPDAWVETVYKPGYDPL